ISASKTRESVIVLLSYMNLQPPKSTLFPYTTLIRSINASQAVVTGQKETDKIYYRHSGFPGGIKAETVAEAREKHPERIIQSAVDRKSTRLNSSHVSISYAVFCLKTEKDI